MILMKSIVPVLAANAVASISRSRAPVLDLDESEDMSPDIDDHDVTT